MNNFKRRLYEFMYGRYGSDALNIFLIIFVMVSLLINSFFIRNYPITIALWLCLILYCFRMYSRNIIKRRKENEVFLKITKPLRKRYSLMKKQKQDPQNKYVLCPSCQQIIRVPKNRGKITITCPTCQKRFDKKT